MPPSDDFSTGGQRYLIVTGLMRSGTTLLYRLLNNHPQIALTFETDLFALRPLLWPSWRRGVWHQRLEFWSGILSNHGIDETSAALLPPLVKGPGEALEVLSRAYARQVPYVYLGGKSVKDLDGLPCFARALPNARFVVLWRSMAEIIDSLHRAAKTNAYMGSTLARRRRLLFQQYSRLAEGVLVLRRLGRPVHELVYRELVADPETACRGLCDFLELPWAPEMLIADPRNLSAIPEETIHFHARHSVIGAVPDRRPEIAAPIAAQIRSYEAYWTARFAGQPIRPVPRSELPPGATRRFFVFERWVGACYYWIHRGLTFAQLLVYRFLPLTLLRLYRAFKWRNRSVPDLGKRIPGRHG